MSNVCKFFQTNSCRYGNRCRFRHVYDDQLYESKGPRSGTSILKGGTQTSNISPPQYPQTREDVDIRKFTEDVAIAVKSVEDQGIWPLSCYGCIQSFGNLDGFEDISPEELRCKAYEARANGTFQAYVEDTQMKLKKAAALRSVFLGKGPTASSILKSYYMQGLEKDRNQSKPTFQKPTSFQDPNFFGGNSQTGFQPLQKPQQHSSFSSNIFAQALRDSTNDMQTSPFGQPVQGNIFGQASVNIPQHPMPFFSQPQPGGGSDLFKQNIFGSAIQPSLPTANESFFQQHPSVMSTPFAQPNFPPPGGSKQVSMNVLYSQINDLTPDELEQYKATTFAYGKTPLKPPPKELC